jgi:hypothetical protein
MDTPETHFVAYHNIDERGSQLWRGGSGTFETNKSSLPHRGDVLWCFEGHGRPRRFTLVNRGVVTRTTKPADGPSLVHYKTSGSIEPAEVNALPWFPKLFRSQGSFGFGLNAIRDRDIVDQLEAYAEGNLLIPVERYTEHCAYTLKHSSLFGRCADGEHTIDTKGKSWARIRVATLSADQAGNFQALELPENEIQEHQQAIESAAGALREWRDKLQSGDAAVDAPAQPELLPPE